MRILFFSLLVLIMTSEVFAQAGTVSGTIQTSDNQPASFVNVSLKGTAKGAVSDAEGFYSINNVKPGEYTLQVTSVGFNSHETSITVPAGDAVQVPTIQLEISQSELQEVLVFGDKDEYVEKESHFVSKMPLGQLENPQVYTSINAELLQDQVVTNFDDALKNAPGLFKLWESTGRGGDGSAYYSLRGFSVQPRMLNGLPGITNGSRDPINVSKIEVIKGPSGTLFGNSVVSYGGLINVVTKTPYDGFGGEVSYTTGSFNLNRVTADVNTPLGNSEKVNVRINAAYHSEGSFQDAGYKKSFFIAPSLSYQVNDRLSFLVNTEFYNPEGTNQTMLFLNRSVALTVSSVEEMGYDNERSYTSNNLFIKTPVFNLQAQMNYKFSDEWNSQTVISRSQAKSDGIYSYLYAADGSANVFARYISDQNTNNSSIDIQQNLTGDVDLGGMRHRILFGLDFFRRENQSSSTAYTGLGLISLRDSIDDTGVLSEQGVANALAGAAVTNSRTVQNFYSAYVSDVVNFTPALSALVALRIDRFDNNGDVTSDDDNYEQTALSPKFGLIYQPIQDRLSLFANYMNGFSNVAPQVQGDGSTKTFDPEHANQFEAGVKVELLDNMITGTISYFDIEVSNIVMEDPAQVNFYIQGGEEYRKGFETEIVANPLAGLNLIAGYSYIDAKITKTDSEDYLDRRPEEAGPKHLVNGWISYRFTETLLKGFGLGFGGNYMSENYILNRKTTGQFILPSYTILNASVSYDAPDFRVTLKVNNLTDKEYYSGWSTINPQQPRSIIGSVVYKF